MAQEFLSDDELRKMQLGEDLTPIKTEDKPIEKPQTRFGVTLPPKKSLSDLAKESYFGTEESKSQFKRGLEEIMTPGSRMQGASDIFRGTLGQIVPQMGPFVPAMAPVRTALAMGSGYGAQKGVETAAKGLGADKGTANLSGDVAGLVMGGLVGGINPKEIMSNPGATTIGKGALQVGSGIGMGVKGHPILGLGLGARGLGNISEGIEQFRKAGQPWERTGGSPVKTKFGGSYEPEITAKPGSQLQRGKFTPPEETADYKFKINPKTKALTKGSSSTYDPLSEGKPGKLLSRKLNEQEVVELTKVVRDTKTGKFKSRKISGPEEE